MRITHQKIADDIGVSRATVTQALHGTRSSNLRPELRREVLNAARRMGYEPRNRTTHTIGYVLPMDRMQLAGESRNLMLTDQALRASGYRLTLSSVYSDGVDALPEMLTPKTVDGVIFTRWFDGKIQSLLSPEIPWLLTSDEAGPGPDVDVVTVDTVQAADRITQHLIDAGHERICLVTGVPGHGFHERQKQGATAALRRAGLPGTNLTTIETGNDSEIADALRTLLRGANAPTAVIGAGAEKTLTALNLLLHDGYRVPDDISIVSLLDHLLLQPMTPSITTTTFGASVAEAAVERLLEKIQNPASTPRQVQVAANIIERESVAKPRSL